jgi:Arc/MetJ-type ribon-helix-helix transcriptional regulator
MQPQAIRPDVERFIEDQVKAGRFASREALVEAAVERMMFEAQASTLDAIDVAEIRAAQDRIDRGEFVEFDSFAAKMRKKYSGE